VICSDFVMTFVVFSHVYSRSIDFEVYSVRFLSHLLTLKSIPLFVFTFVVFSDVSEPSIDFEVYSAICIHFCMLL